jgi:hypothetical protein
VVGGWVPTVGRHAAAWVASAAALAVMPAVAAALSWRMSDWTGETGGLSFYVRGWRSSEAQAVGPSNLINPFSPGPLILLAVISLAAVVGEWGCRRFPWLRWAFPVLPAVGFGVLAMVGVTLALPSDLPRSVPVIVGIAACVSIGLIATIYWGVVQVFARVRD